MRTNLFRFNFYDAKTLYDDNFKSKTEGKKDRKKVLVIGHSNTNPTFVNQVIGEKKYEWINEKNYNTLFIVTKVGEEAVAELINVPFN